LPVTAGNSAGHFLSSSSGALAYVKLAEEFFFTTLRSRRARISSWALVGQKFVQFHGVVLIMRLINGEATLPSFLARTSSIESLLFSFNFHEIHVLARKGRRTSARRSQFAFQLVHFAYAPPQRKYSDISRYGKHLYINYEFVPRVHEAPHPFVLRPHGDAASTANPRCPLIWGWMFM